MCVPERLGDLFLSCVEGEPVVKCEAQILECVDFFEFREWSRCVCSMFYDEWAIVGLPRDFVDIIFHEGHDVRFVCVNDCKVFLCP